MHLLPVPFGHRGGSITRTGYPSRPIGTRSWSWQQCTQYRQTPSVFQAQSCLRVVTAFSAMKRFELSRFNDWVTDWERNEYLEFY